MSTNVLRYALATVLHDGCCSFDHTDQCSWLYEEDWPDTWSCLAHRMWLKKADKTLATHPDITLTRVREVMDAQRLIAERLKEWRTE